MSLTLLHRRIFMRVSSSEVLKIKDLISNTLFLPFIFIYLFRKIDIMIILISLFEHIPSVHFTCQNLIFKNQIA